jgi:hypothetical protein
VTGDPRDERTNEDLARELREAARPDIEPGAARRIADGAWRRDAERREAGRAPLFARPLPVNAWRRMRRLGVAACLVTAAGIGVFGLHGTEPAFAVDGDPVQVWTGEEWEDALKVEVGSFVFVPGGVRTLRGRDGSRIDPRPGACFRLAADLPELSFKIEVLRGRAEVLGPALTLDVADVSVEPEDPTAFHVDVKLVTAGHTGQWDFTPPADPVTVSWEGTPVIRAVQNVRLSQRITGESLSLQPAETATLVAVEDAPAPQRLAYLEAWSAAVPERIAAGNLVVNVDSDRFVLYGGRGFECVELPAPELRLDALVKMNEASTAYLGFVSDLHDQQLEVEQHIRVLQQLVDDTPPRRELRLERNGESVVVRILATGAVTLQRSSQVPEHFDSVKTLRAAKPEAAALFGKLLED